MANLWIPLRCYCDEIALILSLAQFPWTSRKLNCILWRDTASLAPKCPPSNSRCSSAWKGKSFLRWSIQVRHTHTHTSVASLTIRVRTLFLLHISFHRTQVLGPSTHVHVFPITDESYFEHVLSVDVSRRNRLLFVSVGCKSDSCEDQFVNDNSTHTLHTA